MFNPKEMFKLNLDTSNLVLKAQELNKKQRENISRLLDASNGYNDEIFGRNARIVGVNVLGVGAELLVLQILENLKRGFLLLALIGVRALLENFINIHYIFWHPKHEHDERWADTLCSDLMARSYDEKSRKNKLGNISLARRAEETNWASLFQSVYGDLSSYAHFLANVTDIAVPIFFQAKTVEAATYTMMMYQDSIMALASFMNCKVEYYGDEVNQLKDEGQAIINKLQQSRSKASPQGNIH